MSEWSSERWEEERRESRERYEMGIKMERELGYDQSNYQDHDESPLLDRDFTISDIRGPGHENGIYGGGMAQGRFAHHNETQTSLLDLDEADPSIYHQRHTERLRNHHHSLRLRDLGLGEGGDEGLVDRAVEQYARHNSVDQPVSPFAHLDPKFEGFGKGRHVREVVNTPAGWPGNSERLEWIGNGWVRVEERQRVESRLSARNILWSSRDVDADVVGSVESGNGSGIGIGIGKGEGEGTWKKVLRKLKGLVGKGKDKYEDKKVGFDGAGQRQRAQTAFANRRSDREEVKAEIVQPLLKSKTAHGNRQKEKIREDVRPQTARGPRDKEKFGFDSLRRPQTAMGMRGRAVSAGVKSLREEAVKLDGTAWNWDRKTGRYYPGSKREEDKGVGRELEEDNVGLGNRIVRRLSRRGSRRARGKEV